MRTNEEIVTSKDDARTRKANDERKEEMPITDDVSVSNSTKRRYVRNKSGTAGSAVTIGGRYSTYKISNNFCAN